MTSPTRLDAQSLSRERLVVELYRRGLLRTWYRDRPEGWRLLSGLWSPFYLQLRSLPSHPDLLRAVGRFLSDDICSAVSGRLRLLGVATAGVPIATAVSLVGGIPCAYTRKLEGVRGVSDLRDRIASYGEHSLIEGDLEAGDRIVLVDDLVTQFDSKLVAIQMLAMECGRRGIADCRVVAVGVVVDREQGALVQAREQGVQLLSVVRFRTDCLPMLEGIASQCELEVIREYIASPEAFQHSERQATLLRLAEEGRKV